MMIFVYWAAGLVAFFTVMLLWLNMRFWNFFDPRGDA